MDSTDVTLDQIRGFMDEDGLSYCLREDGSALEAGFRGRSGSFRMVLYLRDEPALLGIMVRLPEAAPEDRRPQMAEAVTRANHGLALGCFELDMSSGDIDFRIGIPVVAGTLSHEQFRAMMGAAMWTTDRYHRAFCRLLYGDDLSPAEVIAEVEMAAADEAQDDAREDPD